MKTVKCTMAQALIRFLSQQFVSFDGNELPFIAGIFAIFGHGNVTGIGEALENQNHGLPFYQGHNEQGMAHAAIAFAKQCNRLKMMACSSSIGPGATNMLTAAATATANRIPLLLLPGDIFASRAPDPVLQQIEIPHDYSISVNDAFRPLSRYWDRINRPEQLMQASINALRVLTSPADTGAVTLCLPQDVQAESYAYPEHFFKKRVWHIDRLNPSSRAIEQASQIIKKAKKPLIIAGGGIHYSLATQTLVEFAHRHKIPVCETQAGKSALRYDDSMNLGGVGVTGSLSANLAAQDADVVIALGTRLQDFTTASKSAFQNPKLQIIHINVNAMDAAKLNGFSVLGDCKQALMELSKTLADYKTPFAYQQWFAHCRQQWCDEVKRINTTPNQHPELSQTQVLSTLNQVLDEKDVVVCAAGSLPGDLHRLWQSKHTKDYHVEYAYSCMGYEVAAGLGVKLAHQEGEVYVVVGDGSYLMMHSEIITAIQEGLKVNIILFNNYGYQCIKQLQKANGSKGYGNDFKHRNPQTKALDGPPLEIDFCAYAKALGMHTQKANTLDDFKQALQRQRAEQCSCFIEVKVNANSMSQGYHTWWDVGVAEISTSDAVAKAYLKMKSMRERMVWY